MRTVELGRFAAILAALALACSSKDNSNGLLECGPDKPDCPAGFVCDLTAGFCHLSSGGIDAGIPDARVADAASSSGGDAAAVDASTASDANTLAPPDTTITQKPAAFTNQTMVTLAFTSDRSPVSFECRLDSVLEADFRPCATPTTLMVTAAGAHKFDVRAKDARNVLDPSPASATWTLDLTAPDTTIASGPSGMVVETSATFTFSSTEANSSFQCSIDGAPVATCASGQTFPGLVLGPHTIMVAAIDPAGNIDDTPATQSWTIITSTSLLPDTMITLASVPELPASTEAVTVIFKFISIPDGGTFECRLDSMAEVDFQPCTSPKQYQDLADMEHVFEVRAGNEHGVDPSPAVFHWRVDTSALVVGIGGTHNGVGCATQTFAFAASGQGLTYQCELDGGGFADCSSGTVTYTGLANGSSHTFTVHATDGSGNVGPNSASAFVVDDQPPMISITSPLPGMPTGGSATLTFAANEDSIFDCLLDGAAISGCVSGMQLDGLDSGSHTVVVNGLDQCKIKGTASVTWTADATPPAVTITGPSSGSTVSCAGTIFFFLGGAVDATCTLDGDDVSCGLNGTPPTAGSVPYDSALVLSHTFTVTATDQFGNSSTDTTSFTGDCQPPIVTYVVMAGQPTGGQASFSFALTDDSSISAIRCVLDGVENATNCGSGETGGITVSVGNGDHVLEVYGIDVWGNSGQTYTASPAPYPRVSLKFTISGCNTGRAILFAHNFSDLGTPDPGTHDTPLQQLFANAVLSGVPLPKVLGLHASNLDDADCTPALSAVTHRLGSGSGACATGAFPGYTQLNVNEASDSGNLDAIQQQLTQAMQGKNVLIVFAMTDTTFAKAIGQRMKATFVAFLNAGNVIVVIEGFGQQAGTKPVTFQVLNDGKPGAILASSDPVAYSSPGSEMFINQPNDPVAANAPSFFTAPAKLMLYQSTDPYAVGVTELSYKPGSFPGGPSVFDKPFPAAVTVMTHLPGPDSQVVFQDAAGGNVVVPADLYYGTAINNLCGGGTVTVASSGVDTESRVGQVNTTSYRLMTFMQAKPFDILDLLAQPFVQKYQGAHDGVAHFPAATPEAYVSASCNADIAGPGAGEDIPFVTGCNGVADQLVRVIAVLADADTNRPTKFVVGTGDTNDAIALPPYASWNLTDMTVSATHPPANFKTLDYYLAADTTGRSFSAPDDILNRFPEFLRKTPMGDPTVTIKNIADTIPAFYPTSDLGAGVALFERAKVDANSASLPGTTTTIITRTTRFSAAGDPNWGQAARVIDLATFLPPVRNVTWTSEARPQIAITADGPMSAADGMYVGLFWTDVAPDAKRPQALHSWDPARDSHSWDFYNVPVTGFTAPQLPAAFDRWLPTATSTPFVDFVVLVRSTLLGSYDKFRQVPVNFMTRFGDNLLVNGTSYSSRFTHRVALP